jgi:hypothetical protein
MDLRVQGRGPADPFLSARDLFETDLDLDRPREVVLRLEEVPGREERVGRAATLYAKVHVYRRHGSGAFEACPPGDARRPPAPV